MLVLCRKLGHYDCELLFLKQVCKYIHLFVSDTAYISFVIFVVCRPSVYGAVNITKQMQHLSNIVANRVNFMRVADEGLNVEMKAI